MEKKNKAFNLKSMTEFILSLPVLYNYDVTVPNSICLIMELFVKLSLSYAIFLRQKLELWMFVPCKFVDGVWVVLEEPVYEKYDFTDFHIYKEDLKEYQEAKNRVLFEGKFTQFGKSITYGLYIIDGFIIEDLVKYNLELTPTAIKEIGL